MVRSSSWVTMGFSSRVLDWLMPRPPRSRPQPLPSLGWVSVPNSFVSLFVFYIFSYLLLKTMGCFSGCLMSSASIQKLFCGIYSAFKCSFDEFVGEKVVSPSYSSAILGLHLNFFKISLTFVVAIKSSKYLGSPPITYITSYSNISFTLSLVI